MPDDHPWADLHISPQQNSGLELWMLGSSGGSAELAGQVGMNLALARFIASDHCSPAIFDAYERAWTAAGHVGRPNRAIALKFYTKIGEPPALLERHAKFENSGNLMGTPKREPPSNTFKEIHHERHNQSKSHPLGV